MGESLDNLPQLEGWLGITEAAEVLGVSRQYSFRMAKRTNDGLEGGWQTIHQVGTKPHYLIRHDEVMARKLRAEAGEKIFGKIQIEDLNEDQSEDFHPSQRLINATSWWLAAELVRRNPHLMILETHPGGGMYDCLAIRDGRDIKKAPPLADFNRIGSLHLFEAGKGYQGRTTIFSWPEILASPHMHLVVDKIESTCELTYDSDALPTPRVLAYEFIATALAIKMNDPADWDARNEFLDSSGDDTGWTKDDDLRGYINEFPPVVHPDFGERDALIDRTPVLGIWREPYSHYWAVLRDEEPVLLVSIEGVIYTREKAFQLSELSVEMVGGMQVLAAKLLEHAMRQ